MKRDIVVLAALVLLGGAFWGVSAYLHGRAEASETNNVIDLAVGETREVALESNATTGFKWVATFDDKVMELAEERYDEPSGGALGAPGTQVFVFRGLAKGTTKVVFEYKRPWETQPAEQKQEITFNVR